MSKKIFYLLISLIIQLGIFVQPVYAVSCEDSKISWDPHIFTEGAAEYKLKFTIENANASNNLKGKYVYLVIDKQIYNGGYPTASVLVENNTFEITLPTGGATDKNIHWATLRSTPSGSSNYTDVCSEISYQVGTAGLCRIDPNLQSSNPPYSPLIIRFVGAADTNYKLIGRVAILYGLGTRDIDLSQTKTGSGGQGQFPPIILPGDNGDSVKLIVYSSPGKTCNKDIKIDITAQPQPSLAPSTVLPQAAAEPIRQCPKEGEKFNEAKHLKCTKGAGKPCTTDLNNPGIATAIGCIHTQPAALVKDLLTFVIGIGGGLAFLMMLLGVFQMLTSAGNPETLSAGRDRLQSAIIGLLFIIFSVLLLRIIGVDILGLGKQFGF